MVQSLIGTRRVNGGSSPGEFLTKEMEFWTLKTTLDIRPTGVIANLDTINPDKTFPFEAYGLTFSSESNYNTEKDAQERFDTIIRTVGTRAQPIILGDVQVETLQAPVNNLPVTSTNYSPGDNVDVYTLKFAIEHKGAWDTAELTLADTLHNLNGFVFTYPTDNNNVYVFKNDLL